MIGPQGFIGEVKLLNLGEAFSTFCFSVNLSAFLCVSCRSLALTKLGVKQLLSVLA